METLNGNTRYAFPEDGTPAVKLGEGETVEVRLRGFHKGNIRVGKRAYACVFLRRCDAPGWVYVSKGRFLDLVGWIDRDLSGDHLAPFRMTYRDKVLTCERIPPRMIAGPRPTQAGARA